MRPALQALLFSRAFNPISLFSKYGAAGLYVPDFNPARVATSGLGGLWQTSTGLTSVTAVADVVGLVLDESLGAALGPDLLAGLGTFDSATGWTVADTNEGVSDGSFSAPGGVATIVRNATNAFTYRTDFALASGVTYLVEFTLISGTVNVGHGPIATPTTGAANFSPTNIAGGGLKRFFFRQTSGSRRLLFNPSSGSATVTFDNLTVRAVSGNHAEQATAGSRGTLRQVDFRYVWRGDGTDDNLLTPLVPATAMTMIVAVEFNAVSDTAIGTNDGSGNRLGFGTDASGLLQLRVGSDLNAVGADIRDIPGIAFVRVSGSAYYGGFKPLGGPLASFSGTFAGSIPTAVPLRFGSNNNNGAANNLLDGDIYSVLAIQAALTDAEIAAVAERFSRG